MRMPDKTVKLRGAVSAGVSFLSRPPSGFETKRQQQARQKLVARAVVLNAQTQPHLKSGFVSEDAARRIHLNYAMLGAEVAAMLRSSPALKTVEISNKFRLAAAIEATREWHVKASAPLGRLKR